MVTPSRSATAMTEASTVPRPRSSYVSTSSGDAFDVDVTDVLHLEATRLGAAEEVAFGPRLGATRGWVPDLGDHEIGGAGEAHWPHRRRRPVAVGEALPPVGVDAALAGVIFALGPAAITDATSDPSGVPKSAVKEFERYWARRQIEVTAHLDRYGAPPSR
jgi:hypothetical protein